MILKKLGVVGMLDMKNILDAREINTLFICWYTWFWKVITHDNRATKELKNGDSLISNFPIYDKFFIQ